MQNTKRRSLVAKKRKKGKRESFVLSWRDGPLTKRKEKRGKRKDAFASSSSTKKDKKVCPPPPSSLASTSSSSSSSTFYSSPVYYSPRSSLAFEASSRSLSSLSFTYRARVFLFSLSLAEKKKKTSSGRRETKLKMKRRRSSMHTRSSFSARVVVRLYVSKQGKKNEKNIYPSEIQGRLSLSSLSASFLFLLRVGVVWVSFSMAKEMK